MTTTTDLLPKECAGSSNVELCHIVGDDDDVAICGLDVSEHSWIGDDDPMPVCVVCDDLGELE
jgi:hypothetical protein